MIRKHLVFFLLVGTSKGFIFSELGIEILACFVNYVILDQFLVFLFFSVIMLMVL